MSQQSELDKEILQLLHDIRTEAWSNGFNADDGAWLPEVKALLNKRIAEARIDEIEMVIGAGVDGDRDEYMDAHLQYLIKERKRLGDIK